MRRSLVLTSIVGMVSTLTAAHDAPINPDDPHYIRRQYAWFTAQEPARQQQLRRLHAAYQELDPATQARYTRVLQEYNAWLAKLPEADRRRVLDAPTPAARLEEVRTLREEDYVERLPRKLREEYASLPADDRRAKLAEWRTEEADRQEEWAAAQRQWAEPSRIPKNLLGDGRALDPFVKNLRENLGDKERRELDEARANVEELGVGVYLLRVKRLADLHPILPGRVGPKDFDSLPEATRLYLVKHDPNFRKKGIANQGDEARALRKAAHKWPEFALELTEYARRKQLRLPEPLGDCTRASMPPEVQAFLVELESRAKRSPDIKADLAALAAVDGKWPDYPRMIVDLSRKHRLPIAGWTLPGPPQDWDKVRPLKKRGQPGSPPA